jgi:hypothetical protein
MKEKLKELRDDFIILIVCMIPIMGLLILALHWKGKL